MNLCANWGDHDRPTLGHHFDWVPEADLEEQVPSPAQDHDFTIEVPPLEQSLHTQELGHAFKPAA
jgi:hypothetical protein